MGKTAWNHFWMLINIYLLIVYSIVATSDILTIISLVVATILGLGAIWATRRYNNTTRGNAFHF
jgi:hypothetical protein